MDKKKLNAFLVRFIFTARMAGHGIFSKPLRSLLTVLGVTIGVASVVALMGIGEGARLAVMEQFESLGSNVIQIVAHDESAEFDPELAKDLVERVQGMNYASPIVNVETQMKWKRTRGDVKILGVNEQFPIIRDQELLVGEFFSMYHVKQRANVAVLGYTMGQGLMNGRSPIGRHITLNGQSYRIIGVLKEKGVGKADGIDEKIVIPYTCAQQIAQKRTAEEIWGKGDSPEGANLAVVQLGRIFRKMYHIGEEEKDSPIDNGGGGMPEGDVYYDDYGYEEPAKPSIPMAKGEDIITITSLNQMVEEADEANRVMSLLLGGIAAVSLLVGGLGIMNIMLVAVSERTEEIGVRRALGAQKSDLLMQFLLEAFYVSIMGCVAGILLGMLGTSVFENYGFQTAISLQSIKIASLVAVGSGIVFGVYPAISASSIPPVEALRRN